MAEQTVLIRLGADATGLTKGLRDGSKGMREFEGAVDSAIGKLGALAAVAGLGVGLAALAADALHFAESMVVISAKTGESIAEVQRWNFIAGQTGTSVEALADAVNKMQRSLVTADEDGGKAARALFDIGLNVDTLLKMRPTDQFAAIAGALADVENPAKRVADATAILGKSGSAAIPALLEMANKANEFADGMVRIGGPVSDQAINQVESLGDSAMEFKQAITNLTTEILAGLTPALKGFLQVATEVVGGLRLLDGEGDNALVNLDNKIIRAEENLKVMEASAYASFTGITQGTKDAIEAQKALIKQYREEYEALAQLGIAGTKAVNADRVQKQLELEKALSDGTLAEVQVRVQHQKGGRFEDEVDELAHQERKAAIIAEANATILEQDSKFREQMAEQASVGSIAVQDVLYGGLTKTEQFNAESWQNQVKTVSSSLVEMTAGIAQHSKTAFEVNKYATMANVIVNTIQAVTKAWSDYGWPYGAVVGAAIAAAGAAQLSAVKSQTYNGGGHGLAPSQATTPAQPTSPNGSGSGGSGGVLRVEGLSANSILSGASAQALAQKLLDYQKDGGTVVFQS